MPLSAETDNSSPAGQTLAVIAEALYLTNLLLLPGLAFLALLALYLKKRATAPPLAVSHLAQTVTASVWAGVLLVLANGTILALGGYQATHTWIIVILYFTLAHASLVVCGAVGLARALAGQCWRFPLIGRPLPADCPRGPV